jgi:antitoxin component YwqK of YwqJK toxin-antitoxin module
MKDIHELGTRVATCFQLAGKEVKYYEKERLRYYFYPLYGNDDVFYTGWLINNRCEGYGRLSLKGGETNIFGMKSQDIVIYEGDFRKGGIHTKSSKIYHPNGNLRYDGGMLRGKRHSDLETSSKMFYEDQEPEYIGRFCNDEFNGTDVSQFYKNGNLLYKGGMHRGLREGYGVELFESKKVKYDGHFSTGKFSGSDFREYDETGNLIFCGTYEAGLRNGPGVEYYPNGKTRYDGQFKGSHYHGNPIKIYDPLGGLDFLGECNEGLYTNGFGKRYYDSGALMYEGEFFGDQPNGDLCKIYSEDYGTSKNLIFEGVMAIGTMVKGFGMLYWPGTKGIKFEGVIRNGQPHGENIQIWNEDGLLIYEGGMDEGIKEGPGKEWTLDGK